MFARVGLLNERCSSLTWAARGQQRTLVRARRDVCHTRLLAAAAIDRAQERHDARLLARALWAVEEQVRKIAIRGLRGRDMVVCVRESRGARADWRTHERFEPTREVRVVVELAQTVRPVLVHPQHGDRGLRLGRVQT